MAKKALIMDLDNTIYAVSSIGDRLFSALFQLIKESGEGGAQMEQIRKDIMTRPFQLVAAQHGFSEELTANGVALLEELTWEGPIEPFADYIYLQQLKIDKFLVTTGFTLLQRSKIRGLSLEKDFREIHIVDPALTTDTKREVFASIIERRGYQVADVLVVGDDPHSEIRAAQDLGLDAVLYDRSGRYHGPLSRISDFGELQALVEGT